MENDALTVNSNGSFDFRIYTILNKFSLTRRPTHSTLVCVRVLVLKCLNCHAFRMSHIIFVHLWPQFIMSLCPCIVFLQFGCVVVDVFLLSLSSLAFEQIAINSFSVYVFSATFSSFVLLQTFSLFLHWAKRSMLTFCVCVCRHDRKKIRQ